jgi:hypothetical protein
MRLVGLSPSCLRLIAFTTHFMAFPPWLPYSSCSSIPAFQNGLPKWLPEPKPMSQAPLSFDREDKRRLRGCCGVMWVSCLPPLLSSLWATMVTWHCRGVVFAQPTEPSVSICPCWPLCDVLRWHNASLGFLLHSWLLFSASFVKYSRYWSWWWI